MKITRWENTVIVELEAEVVDVSVTGKPNYRRWSKKGSRYVPNEMEVTLWIKLENGESHWVVTGQRGRANSPVHLTDGNIQETKDKYTALYKGKKIIVSRMFHKKWEPYMEANGFRAHRCCKQSWDTKYSS